jgi:hypothetical protein
VPPFGAPSPGDRVGSIVRESRSAVIGNFADFRERSEDY